MSCSICLSLHCAVLPANALDHRFCPSVSPHWTYFCPSGFLTGASNGRSLRHGEQLGSVLVLIPATLLVVSISQISTMYHILYRYHASNPPAALLLCVNPPFTNAYTGMQREYLPSQGRPRAHKQFYPQGMGVSTELPYPFSTPGRGVPPSCGLSAHLIYTLLDIFRLMKFPPCPGSAQKRGKKSEGRKSIQM